MSFISFFTHLTFPHESNNHKPKLLQTPSIFLIAFILLGYQLFISILPKSGINILGYASNISIEEVVRLTNEQRASEGLPPLELNSTLSQAAHAKGEDMLTKNYWAHVAPDGTEPWKFFSDVGYKYRYAGENLARDFSNAPSAVAAWMASPSHRENIMSSKYKEIGVAVVEGDLAGADTTIIVQFFGTKYTDTVPAVPVAEKPASVQASTAVNQASQNVAQPSLSTPKPLYANQGELLEASPLAGPSGTKVNVLTSPFTATKTVSLVIVGGLMLLLVVDGIVVSKKNIARVGGRTFAHISFLGMIIAIILLLKAGRII